MTRPNISALELDGNTVKLRLQANRFETCSHVHVDWLRFTCALRNAPIDEAILFPRPAKHQKLERIEHGVVDHVFWRTDAHVVKRFVAELEKVDEYAPAMQALSLAREVAAKLGAEFEVAHDIGKGHDFYAKRWIIQRQGKEVGWVGFGASSESPKQKRQAETIHCNLYGAACTFADPGWTTRMAALIDECQATITRCDLALDFFDGPPFTMEQIRQDLMNGVMDVRGRTPSWNLLGHWSDEARSHSRSIYIGSKEAGKQTNVYEKGDQLYGPDKANPWVRVELRYGNKLRVLPSDMLRRPAHFFAGASDWHASVLRMAEAQVIPAPIPVEQRLADEHIDAAVSRVIAWATTTAGPTLNALFRYLGDDQLLAISRIEEQVLPGRLHGYSDAQLQSAFARCSQRFSGGVHAQTPATA